jgi:hypothetical protein
VSGTVWIRHPELGLDSEVPESAVPFWRHSGWAPLSEQEVADREQTAAEQHAQAERELLALGRGSTSALPPVSEPESAAAEAEQFVPPELLDENVHPTEEGAVGRQATEGA